SRILCRCEPVTEGELIYAARHEQVRTLADAFRRVGIAAGPCAGAACILRASEVIGRELGWSATERFEAARDFVRGSWLGRAPVLGHAGWAQEELAQGAMRGLMVGDGARCFAGEAGVRVRGAPHAPAPDARSSAAAGAAGDVGP